MAGANKLEDKLIELLNSFQEGLTDAVLFGQEHLPDIVNQLLMWEGVKSFVLFVIGVIILVLCFHPKVLKLQHDLLDDDDYFIVVTVMTHVFAIGVGIGCALSNLDWLQILIAPKLYLVEYSANLLG